MNNDQNKQTFSNNKYISEIVEDKKLTKDEAIVVKDKLKVIRSMIENIFITVNEMDKYERINKYINVMLDQSVCNIVKL